MIKELIRDTEILSTPCEKATAEDEQIAIDLAETLASIEDAACLAANQIGETKCIVALKGDDEQVLVFYNPVIKRALFPTKMVEECLTVDGATKVTRFGKIQVQYDALVDGQLVSKKVELLDWAAQLMQHCIDHCKGKLL